jgi:hypothetical protein
MLPAAPTHRCSIGCIRSLRQRRRRTDRFAWGSCSCKPLRARCRAAHKRSSRVPDREGLLRCLYAWGGSVLKVGIGVGRKPNTGDSCRGPPVSVVFDGFVPSEGCRRKRPWRGTHVVGLNSQAFYGPSFPFPFRRPRGVDWPPCRRTRPPDLLP